MSALIPIDSRGKSPKLIGWARLANSSADPEVRRNENSLSLARPDSDAPGTEILTAEHPVKPSTHRDWFSRFVIEVLLVSTGDMPWRPPLWQPYRKHQPVKNEHWSKVVRSTRGEGSARYHSNLSPAEIERIEMETVRRIIDEEVVIPGFGVEITPSPRRNERIFWRRLDFVVGASSGQETCYIYVVYNQTGTVHGYPITEDELRKVGVEP